MGRVVSEENLVAEREEARRQGKVVVFTNGCFDLLHRGHADYLAGARRLGDILYVGVNDDASVARLKGAGRPLVSEEDRAALVAALASVDRVVLFGEDTPRRLIARLLPDVLVKGGDYSPDEIVGAAEVRGAGGRVVVVPFVPGRSSSDLISKILNELGPRSKGVSKPLSP
jgi:D-beta-D-heptose 7-phosphate kinase/D-beta-D-heptose 1-phosphate adenosyltransferase